MDNGICIIKDIITEDNILLDFRTLKKSIPVLLMQFFNVSRCFRSIFASKRLINANMNVKDLLRSEHIWTIILNSNKEVFFLKMFEKDVNKIKTVCH